MVDDTEASPQRHASALISAMVGGTHSEPALAARQIDASVQFCLDCVAAGVPCPAPHGGSLDFALSLYLSSKTWTKSNGNGAKGLVYLFRAYVATGMIPLNRLADGKLIPSMLPAGMAPLEWPIRRGDNKRAAAERTVAGAERVATARRGARP